MKKTIWDKRIPTLLGLILIVIGVGFTSYLVSQGVIVIQHASPTSNPQNVRISNITDSSFTVSYVTDARVIGSINYGPDQNLSQTALDDRDQQTGSLSSYKIHSITIRNLSPSTKYYFSITSGQNKYLNNGAFFETTTGPTIQNSPSEQKPIVGKIIMPNGSSPTEAIIYITAGDAQVISSLVKSDGTYLIPLNSMRIQDLSSYVDFSTITTLSMLIYGDGLSSNVSLSINQINPVPAITLSNDYNFVSSSQPVASSSAGQQQSFQESLPSPIPETNTSNNAPKITVPQGNEGFTDQQPLFKGTARPNQTIKIVIHSYEQIQAQVTADAYGNWSFRPTAPLSPGNHTIYITTLDANGISRTISQTFTVYPSGSQVNQSATPSATIAPTPTPTTTPAPTLLPTPTPAVSPTPTPMPTPTQSATPSATIAPTPTPIPSPSAPALAPGGKSPGPGNTIVTVGILGGILTIIGAAVLFAL